MTAADPILAAHQEAYDALRDLLWQVLRDRAADLEGVVRSTTLADIVAAVGYPPDYDMIRAMIWQCEKCGCVVKCRDCAAREPLDAPAPTPRGSTPSPAEIEAAKTTRGAWTRAQLAEWGVPWPPPGGWKRRLEEAWRAAHPQFASAANGTDPAPPVIDTTRTDVPWE